MFCLQKLATAARRGQIRSCKLCLENNADVNYQCVSEIILGYMYNKSNNTKSYFEIQNKEQRYTIKLHVTSEHNIFYTSSNKQTTTIFVQVTSE